jgi:putative tricarboxylic transport membrane protein
LAFGLILGPILEENVRRSLMISQGDWLVFLERPVALAFILISVSLLVLPAVLGRFRGRSAASSAGRVAEGDLPK